MTTPILALAGPPKSGTTGILATLCQLDHFRKPLRKEPHFLALPELQQRTAGPGDQAAIRHATTSLSDYWEALGDRRASQGQLCIDASPSNFVYAKSAFERAERFTLDMRAVVLERDRAERAISQYLHMVARGRERRTFNLALELEKERRELGYSDMWHYADNSMYASRIELLVSRLGRERVRILRTGRQASDAAAFQRIAEFLGLEISGAWGDLAAIRANEMRQVRLPRVAAFISAIGGGETLRRVVPPSAHRLIHKATARVIYARPESPDQVKARLRAEMPPEILQRFAEDERRMARFSDLYL